LIGTGKVDGIVPQARTGEAGEWRLLERTIVLENDAYLSWASVSCYISQGKPPEGKIQGCIEY
jgi:hypothetical protein